MILSCLFVACALLLLIACLRFRHTQLGWIPLSLGVILLSCGLAVILPQIIDAVRIRPGLSQSDTLAQARVPSMLPIATNSPLAVHQLAPPLEAVGWVNGDATALARLKGQLVVVDLWANWCPVCQEFAPGLVKTYGKYSAHGVSFVSLSNDSQGSVQQFIKRFSIPWLSGYAASVQTIARFNAFSNMPMPGYEVRPTLYLLDGDGRVLWCDGHARYRHQKAEEVIEELESAIDIALAETTGRRRLEILKN